ncbi:hypothetical protein I4131_12370 [Staphylococcus aureus]|nr:hypothetical protein [Staphylococcus aureus]
MSSKKKHDFITYPLTLVYMGCISISANLLCDSDITTVLIPIILYTVVNIILRNSPQGDSNLRLQDFNDFNLVGYAISYLMLKKTNMHEVIANNIFHNHNLGEDWVFITSIMSLGIFIVVLICVITVPKVSKIMNKDSHYQ